MNELKKRLLELAKLHLNEQQYNTINACLKKEKLHKLRWFLGDLIDNYEIRNMVDGSRMEEWSTIDKMNDIAIELAIYKEDEVDGGVVTRKRNSSRPKIILQ
jgi:hypothetical protein